METKQFGLAAVLGVTTGRLLSEMGDMYAILNWMTNDELFTHQLPRASRECEPWLLRWFPAVKAANESLHVLDKKIEELGGESGCKFWLANMELIGLPAMFDVPRIPRGEHEQRNPVDELCGMIGDDRVIVVACP